MSESILVSTKRVLGIEPDYTHFDPVITMHINSVFSNLEQLGVGPKDCFSISGPEQTWDEFTGGDNRYNQVMTYMYLRVRILFDPPGNSFHMDALNEQRQELEWRMNVLREGDKWKETQS